MNFYINIIIGIDEFVNEIVTIDKTYYTSANILFKYSKEKARSFSCEAFRKKFISIMLDYTH
jgi:hypothetical protein